MSSPALRSLGSHHKLLVIHFDLMLRKILALSEPESFKAPFYHSSNVASRPNSTMRLSVVNVLAWRELGADFMFCDDIEDLKSLLGRYDTVVVHAIASARVHAFMPILVEAVNELESAVPRIVFGTESSWFNELKKGTVSTEAIDLVYKRSLLLRHTARTDRPVYTDDGFESARIQEFELGIDTDVVHATTPIADRTKVLFVAAPEGRTTKNNEEIEEIVAALRSAPVEGLDVEVLAPPYSSTEYWDLLEQTRFLVFTSVGETFSYVLNDANAMGVVTLRRPELFRSATTRLAVDSYPDVGVRYRDAEHAVELLRRLSLDCDGLERLSTHARAVVASRFSHERVLRNWTCLIGGENMNTERLLIADADAYDADFERLCQKARSLGCNYVMPYLNRGTKQLDLTSFSFVESKSQVTVVPFAAHETESGFTLNTDSLRSGRAIADWEQDVAMHLRLVVRTYKIGEVFVDRDVDAAGLRRLVDRLTYLHGDELRRMPVITC